MKRMTRGIFLLSTVLSALILRSITALALDLPESMRISDDNTRLIQSIGTAPGFYDETVLRTISLEFDQPDWWEQLIANYKPENEIPATLTMDDITCPAVGVRFKGMTSYTKTGASEKKSFNISIDFSDSTQRLAGYKTVNLNNCFDDPSFMREVLYFNICRKYIPCAKANFVKLVINDENWGIYANVQQLNSNFINEWFLSNDGDRWKVPMGFAGWGPVEQPRKITEFPGADGTANALGWMGNDQAPYEKVYELKSSHTDDPWQHLITLCDVLNNTPLDQLEETLGTVLDIDRCLWFLAVENIYADDDSYLTKGADFQIYYEPETGRIHPLEYDGNETFANTTRFGMGVNTSPFEGEDSQDRPLIHRLLAVPELRQRYLAHIRTIIDESLDWDAIEPYVYEYRELIRAEVTADTKKLTSTAEFEESYEYLRSFITNRRQYLNNLTEINRPVPEILSVSCSAYSGTGGVSADDPVQVTVAAEGSSGIGEVLLHYGTGPVGRFEHVTMFDDGLHDDGESGNGVYGAEIPPSPEGTLVRYYIEARAADNVGTTSFAPVGAEHDVYVYKVALTVAESSPVMVNELMASNQETIQDPQGDYDDWIELINVSDQTVDLSGMYLSDKEDNPQKWIIPEGTTLAAGAYLIVWADEDGGDQPGLHANFKLSADGESVLLVDTDLNGNAILDLVTFGTQDTDVSYGRYPDGTGPFSTLSSPTPEEPNSSPLIVVIEDIQPFSLNLMQNFPNPFNSHTVIRYELVERADVELCVYSLAGQKIATLAHGTSESGTYQVRWDGTDTTGNDAASGVYVYLLRSGSYTTSRALLLLR